MSKSKFYKIAVVVIVIIASACYYLWAQKGFDYDKNIKKYLQLLDKEPKNCHYLEQIAGSYQALNDYDQAIRYYEQSLDYCPDNLLNLFQLGVCYYQIMERNIAMKHMDEAIKQADKHGNKELKEMFIKEKASWLEKWDLIKKMEWNNDRVNKG